MQISERITRWRESREGMTKAKLARACGVSSAAVAQWESGTTTPSTKSIEAIAAAIGVSVSVFWGEPPATPARKAS